MSYWKKIENDKSIQWPKDINLIEVQIRAVIIDTVV